MTERALILELSRLLATFQARRAGYHGTGRHIGQDFELCQARPAFGSFPARPCSPRCQAVTDTLEAAAGYLGVTVEQMWGWPKRMRLPPPPSLFSILDAPRAGGAEAG